jgi:hypothetical protein
MARKPKKAPAPEQALARPEQVLDPGDAGLLFSPEQIAQLKLTILTGVDPAAKIEAIRKLAFTRVEPTERGALYLKAITDPDPSVRRESAAALQTLGMSPDFADALSTVASGTSRQKALGLSKLKALVPALTPAERSVATAFLSASLSFEAEAEIRAGMLETLGEVVGGAGLDGAGLPSVLGAVIKAVAEDYERCAPPARRFFQRLAAAQPSGAAALLWGQVRPIEDRRLRLMLTSELLSLTMSDALRKEVGAAVARAIAEDSVDDLEARDLRAAFTALGDEAIDAILPLAERTAEDQMPALIGLLDSAAKSASTRGRTAVMEFFLKIWPGSGRTVRVAVMESRTSLSNNVEGRVKHDLARQFIDSLHAFESLQRADVVRAALRRLGPPAIEALRESIERSPYAEERTAAARIIVDICAGENVEDRVLADLVGFFRALENGERIPTGLAVRCAGGLAHRLRQDRALARELIASFRSRLGRVSYAGDLLVALCHAASSPAAERAAAAEMTFQILEFLGGKMPDPTYQEQQGPEGKVISIGRDAAIYTDLIPDLLEGVQWLYASGHLSEHIRSQVVDLLLKLWGRIVRYEDVWAPGNLIHLADALAMMGEASGGAVRDRILSALCDSIRNTGVVRAMARLCGDAAERSEPYAKLMESIALTLFKMLGMEEYREAGDRRAILVTLGRVAGSARIGSDQTRSGELKRRILERISEEGVPTAREMVLLVEWLKKNPAIPEELKAFGVRRGRAGAP